MPLFALNLTDKPGMLETRKAVRPEHVRLNAATLDIRLTPGDLAEIDQAFPPPRRKQPLEMI